MTDNTDKLDFSQLNKEDNSLISWEDLFPEYAIGGETFQSGKSAFSAGVNAENKQTSSFRQKPAQDGTRSQSMEQPITATHGADKSPLPASSFKNAGGYTSPNAGTIIPPKETPVAEKHKMDVLTLTELPDTPSLLDDILTVVPETQAKSTPPSQMRGFTEQPSMAPTQMHGFTEQSSIAPSQMHGFTEQSSIVPSQMHGFTEQSSTAPSQMHGFTEQSSTTMAQTHTSATTAQTSQLAEQTQLPNMEWLDNALDSLNQEIITGNQLNKNQDYWANRFNQLNFPGMDLMAVYYIGSFTYDMLEQHLLLKRVVRDFVRLLSYNYTMELRSAGVSEEGIFYMKKGKIPENYTVHLKYPPEYGGTIDFNNMVFMQDKPFHDMIHAYLDEQILTENGISYPPLLYVPAPVGKIYVPFGMFTGSGGKNKQDRSVYAGFSKAAFEKIALKAMPGR